MKIFFFLIGLLFSSVHGQVLSDADVTHVVSQLMQNTDFVEKCSELCSQGLTIKHIVEQLMKNDKTCVYHSSKYDTSNSLGLLSSFGDVVGVVVGFCVVACGLFGYCNDYCLDGDGPCLMDDMF